MKIITLVYQDKMILHYERLAHKGNATSLIISSSFPFPSPIRKKAKRKSQLWMSGCLAVWLFVNKKAA
ncbi:unnamed protein product [Allacma fusca]|uniref:Uncharacterized protein n=1 Tax=Allacma fusca TaxID=39272 RepID=A0A8J2J487_9HEXA|nr:unnamed protein product [Allacma fusca]